MKKLAIIAIGAVALASMVGVVGRASGGSTTPKSASGNATPVADLSAQQPVDAEYVVPGVLDNRSWKPEYDVMPRQTVSRPRRARVATAALLDSIAAGDTPREASPGISVQAPSKSGAPISSSEAHPLQSVEDASVDRAQ
jgi:hypothetical protein